MQVTNVLVTAVTVQAMESIKTDTLLISVPKLIPLIFTVSPPSYQPYLGEIDDTVAVTDPR